MLGHWAIMLNCSDVVRTYDTADALVIPQTLERVQSYIQLSQQMANTTKQGTAIVCKATNAVDGTGTAAVAAANEEGRTTHVLDPGPYCWPPTPSSSPSSSSSSTVVDQKIVDSLDIKCPETAMVITQILYASFGKQSGTCDPALSHQGCVEQAREWCNSCKEYVATCIVLPFSCGVPSSFPLIRLFLLRVYLDTVM